METEDSCTSSHGFTNLFDTLLDLRFLSWRARLAKGNITAERCDKNIIFGVLRTVVKPDASNFERHQLFDKSWQCDRARYIAEKLGDSTTRDLFHSNDKFSLVTSPMSCIHFPVSEQRCVPVKITKEFDKMKQLCLNLEPHNHTSLQKAEEPSSPCVAPGNQLAPPGLLTHACACAVVDTVKVSCELQVGEDHRFCTQVP